MRIFAKILLALALIAAAPAFAEEQPPTRVGRVSYIEGALAFYGPGDADWSAASVNLPVATGGWFATDPQSRAELRIGAETIDMAGDTQLGVTDLHDGVMRIGVTQGRIDLHIRRLDNDETAEIDIPRGGVWLLQPGVYDIDSGAPDRPSRIAVFEGSARFVGGSADMTIKTGDAVALSGADIVSATVERAAADDFVKWCRSRDYQEKELAAPYRVSPAMTGLEELDAYGGWSTVPESGAIWYPASVPVDWVPYRDGHWVWVAPWGWTWVDAAPWGFAPFHYGRWAYIGDRWGWVPGNFVPRPVFAPALVAFVENVGVAGQLKAGPPVGWFPLAPGEIYWPSFTRNPAYITNVNIANVSTTRITEVTRIAQTQRLAGPPPQLIHQQFANRRAATVVPANVFAGSASVASALVQISPQAVQQARVGLRPPQLMPAATHPGPATLPQPRLAVQPPIAGPASPPNFRALAPAPSGPHGHAVAAQQPGQAAPGSPPTRQPPAPPSFSHLAPAPAHAQPPAAQAPSRPAQTQATPGHPPAPPNFSRPAPAAGTQRPAMAPPPAQAARGEPTHAPPAQTAPQEMQRAAERAAQQRAAAEQQAQQRAAAEQQAQQRAAAEQQAQQRAAAEQQARQRAAAERQAQQHAAAEQQAQQRAAAEQQARQRAAAEQQAQQRAAAQAAVEAPARHEAAQQHSVAPHPPSQHEPQGRGNCEHPGQPNCTR